MHQLIIGFDRLNVQNITWLANGGWGDSWAHYLGWQNYRLSEWQIPIGANNKFGLELSTSIVYTDSIPWLAILFKLFSVFLPTTFQYFGIWILICFILQSYFAWKVIRIFTQDFPILVCGSLFLLFTPAFLNRLNTHVALSSHFLILASIYLMLKADVRYRFTKWFLLLALAAGVHAYFLMMTLCFFLADVARSYLERKLSRKKVLLNFLLMFVTLTTIIWQLGYFVVSTGIRAPFQPYLFKVDLLQPVNLGGWSWVASSSFPDRQGNFEGFNYLGLGVLGLIFLSLFIIAALRINFQKLIEGKFLIFFLLMCFGIYSLSNQVTLGRYALLTYNYPWFIEPFSETFRAVGRFFWPVTYFSIFAGIFVISKLKKRQYAVGFLIFLACLQLGDSHYGWRKVQEVTRLPMDKNIPRFDEDFWSSIAQSYSSVRVFPKYSMEESCDWRKVGLIAYKFNLSTNCVTQARVDSTQLRLSQSKFLYVFETGKLDAQTLYYFDEKLLNRLKGKIRLNNLWVTHIDGFLVISQKKLGAKSGQI